MKTKRDLQRAGFKPVPGFDGLYIDRRGAVYDYHRRRDITPNNPARLQFHAKRLSVPKLILLVFAKQPYQKRQVRHLDGNANNLQVNNLQYAPTKADLTIDPAALMRAVRCYFQVPKRYKTNDHTQTRYYLAAIASKRGFVPCHRDAPGIGIFESYLNDWMLNKTRVAEKHGIQVRRCIEIINPLIKQLIAEVLQDLECGYLAVQDYRPRPQTNAQALKEYNASLRERGIAPIKIPRKKSDKQILREWDQYIDQMRKEAAKSADKS